MKYLIPQVIDKHQTGFMPERFIADNGVTTCLIMDIAQRFKLPGVALLLDQEKAYDRVHPKYLQACLERFGFPLSLIHSQARGLRQGDPLSPLLFNLAIEPLLRSIWSSRLIPGFQISNSIRPESISTFISPPPLKAMAYADDVIVFLNKPNELQALLRIVLVYGQASNAQLNRDKTLAVSLSGEPHPEWRRMLEANQIFQWHDNQIISAAIYLGYPLTSSKQQVANYLLSIIQNMAQYTSKFRHL
ncbi:hypothetical protein G6F56_010671 [Rhizopus delemar]|nr:hypothetical protein G6F56_010671 [Rhizopus delemar]